MEASRTVTPRPRATPRANTTRRPQKLFLRQSTRLKPNPSPVLPLFPRVLSLGLLRLRNLSLQHPLRHHPLRRISIRAPRMNRIHAHIENIPATKAIR